MNRQLSRQPCTCYSTQGIMDKTAPCAPPRATFSIHRHEPRIWIFMCSIQTISCSPGRPLLAGTLAGKEILQKRRTNLDTLEKTKKKTGEHSVLPCLEWLSIQTFSGVESRENFQDNLTPKDLSFYYWLTQIIPKCMHAFSETTPFSIFIRFFFYFIKQISQATYIF